MHRYLGAVGLKSLDTQKKLRGFIDDVIEEPDTSRIIQTGPDENFAVLTRRLTKRSGIALCGEYEDRVHFRMDSYFPYVISEVMSTCCPCEMRQMAGQDAWSGMCDDYRLGVSLIFFLNNFMYLQDARGNMRTVTDICLSGLSDTGKILLPIKKSEKEKTREQVAEQRRERMMEEAKNGNAEAIESLTLEDMSLYNSVKARIGKEDLYTFVDSFFMPNGMESDQYSVMGEIVTVEPWKNLFSEEEGFDLLIDCNDIPILISIQKEDLLGEPEPGRRFKGDVWIQGSAEFLL